MYQVSADSWYITIFFSKITPVFGTSTHHQKLSAKPTPFDVGPRVSSDDLERPAL